MGSAASKASRVASTTARRYPTKPQDLPHTSPHAPSSTIPSSESSTNSSIPTSYDTALNIDPDTTDLKYSSMLHTVGVVDSATAMSVPIPLYTSTSPSTIRSSPLSPSIHILQQRASLQNLQVEESRDPKLRERRRWVDTGSILRILQLRDELKWEEGRIEKELGLGEGVVKRLGKRVEVP